MLFGVQSLIVCALFNHIQPFNLMMAMIIKIIILLYGMNFHIVFSKYFAFAMCKLSFIKFDFPNFVLENRENLL